MSLLTAIKNVIDRILRLLCILFCGGMVLLVSWQVITRFILNDPSTITEELANICFVWMSLLAAALLYGEKGHMNINFLPDKLGPVKSQYLSIISEIFTLILAVWVLSYGGSLIAAKGMAQTNAAMTWLKIGQIYSVVAICGICVDFYAIYNIQNSIIILAIGKKE